MHHLAPAGPRRQLRILLVAVLLLASSLTSALAHQATPAPDGTRLYLSHAARLTARIPDDWEPDRSLDHDVAGRDGYIASGSTALAGIEYASIEAACDGVNASAYDDAGSIELATWRGMDACTVRPLDALPAGAVTLVFAHPDPAPDGTTLWAYVTVDAAHFDAVTDSISFDLSGITAAEYLDAALDIVETHVIQRDLVDWDDLRARAHQRLGGFADMDAYWVADAALQIVVDALRHTGADAHTFFVPAVRVDTNLLPAIESYTDPSGEGLGHGIGYLVVPGFTAGPEQMDRYTGALHAVIADEAPDATCGWIVDLRDNTGGNIPPMVAGLAPLLPPGSLLDLRDANGDETIWDLTADGTVEIDGEPTTAESTAAAPPDPRLGAQPVAVLIGPRTASAAEATAIAFVDRDRTAFVGEPTFGAASGPIWIPLIDGSLLSITTVRMVGPQGAIFPDGIAPDITVSPSDTVAPLADDPAVQAASDWLRQQPGCDLAA